MKFILFKLLIVIEKPLGGAYSEIVYSPNTCQETCQEECTCQKPAVLAGNVKMVNMGSIPSPRDDEKLFNFFKRKNSICMNLTYVPGPVNLDDAAAFVSDVLKVPKELFVAIQLHPVRKYLMVKVEEVFVSELEEKAKQGVVWTKTNTRVTGWRCDTRTTEITLFGVSPDKTEEEIKIVLSQFGEVKTEIQWGKLRGFDGKVRDGTLKLRIELSKDLPPYIMFAEEGEIWKITSNVIVNCCWKCSKPGHIGRLCPEARAPRTWANAAGGRDQSQWQVRTPEEEERRKKELDGRLENEDVFRERKRLEKLEKEKARLEREERKKARLEKEEKEKAEKDRQLEQVSVSNEVVDNAMETEEGEVVEVKSLEGVEDESLDAEVEKSEEVVEDDRFLLPSTQDLLPKDASEVIGVEKPNEVVMEEGVVEVKKVPEKEKTVKALEKVKGGAKLAGIKPASAAKPGAPGLSQLMKKKIVTPSKSEVKKLGGRPVGLPPNPDVPTESERKSKARKEKLEASKSMPIIVKK